IFKKRLSCSAFFFLNLVYNINYFIYRTMKTTEEQLIYIASMISHAKGEIGESSIFFLLWGYLAVSAAVIQYILLQFTSFAEPTLVWPVFMGIGGILSLVISKRKKAKEGSRTYIARFI